MRVLRGLLAIVVMVFTFSMPAFGQAGESIGVVALVNPDATLARAEEERLPVAGEDVFLDDRMLTSSQGQVHLMLVDKSSFTVGPNSDITIDRFVYDPETRVGDMALSAARGVMRFVGGDLSKNNPVEIQTSIGTLGIRGGIMLLEVSEGGGLTAVFSFGTSLSFTGPSGESVAPVVRPGFMIQVSPTGNVSPPIPAPPDVVEGILEGLEAPSPTTPASAPDGGPAAPQVPGGNVPTPTFIAAQVATQLLGQGVTSITQTEDGSILVEFDDDLVDLEGVTEQQIVEVVEQSVDIVEEVNNAIDVLIRLRETCSECGSVTASLAGTATRTPSGASTNISGGGQTDVIISSVGTFVVGRSAGSGFIQVSEPNNDSFTPISITCGSRTVTVTVTEGNSVAASSSGSCD